MWCGLAGLHQVVTGGYKAWRTTSGFDWRQNTRSGCIRFGLETEYCVLTVDRILCQGTSGSDCRQNIVSGYIRF